MAQADFTLKNFLLRFLAACVLVGLTYNPNEVSYFHWAIEPLLTAKLPDFSVLKALVGMVLLIGWFTFLRATLASLGRIGVVLALVFFALLVWLLVEWIPPTSPRAWTYLVMLVLASVLAVGVSWSFVRRRITGQMDVDRIDD
jgi:hypothetical protein